MDESQFGKGLNDRPDDPKDPRDYRGEELASPASMQWMEKDPSAFKTYPIKDQDGSGSCVAQTLSKLLAVNELAENGAYRELSPRSIYSQGFAPDGGMDIRNAAKIITNAGVTLESLLPSFPNTESAMRISDDYRKDAKAVAKVYKPQSVVFINTDFDSLSGAIQQFGITGIGVIGYNNGTWLSEFPQSTVSGNPWYHALACTDFGLINGKRFVSVDNSWGTSVGMQGKQFLDESIAIYSAWYTLNQPDDEIDLPKPKYMWNTDMKIGSKGEDVRMLQIALQYLGCFPKAVTPTGAFYGLTRRAVMTFQEQNGILPVSGIAGPNTRQILNSTFNQ